MKKVMSLILISSIIILGAVSVFAVDIHEENNNYSLDELFMEYREKSLAIAIIDN